MIEERPAQEMRQTAGVQVAPEGIACWNPAFDYAPAALISGIITEFGVIYPTTTTAPGSGEEVTTFDVKGFLEKHGVSSGDGHKDKKAKTSA